MSGNKLERPDEPHAAPGPRSAAPAGGSAPVAGGGLLAQLDAVLGGLLEDPGSTEPFVRLLELTAAEAGARGAALFTAPGNAQAPALLAVTPDDAHWQPAPPAAAVPGAGSQALCEPDPGRPGASLLWLPLGEAGEQGLLVLRRPEPAETLDAARLRAARLNAGRLGRVLMSARRVRHAQSEERVAMARELHDSLAQSLSYMKIQISLLQGALDGGTAGRPELESGIQSLRETVSIAYRQLRELITTFRLSLNGRSFDQALQASVQEFGQRCGVAFELDNRLPAGRLSGAEGMQMLHIVREALTNVARHAHATQCQVRLHPTPEGGIALEVRDDGIGLQAGTGTPGGPLSERRHGVVIMQERAHALGATLQLATPAGGGTLLRMLCPPGPGGQPAAGG